MQRERSELVLPNNLQLHCVPPTGTDARFSLWLSVFFFLTVTNLLLSSSHMLTEKCRYSPCRLSEVNKLALVIESCPWLLPHGACTW